jgi:sterol desaturase/sphingolipid hydroxylase (fatty acid hydroxylase superfamily)
MPCVAAATAAVAAGTAATAVGTAGTARVAATLTTADCVAAPATTPPPPPPPPPPTHAELLAQADALVDMRAPLLPQLSRLSAAQYLVWAHTPHVYTSHPKHARLFESDAWEALSKTRWPAVPAVWLPVVACLWAPYARAPWATAAHGALLALCGLLCWSAVEYGLHRWLFHADAALPDHPAARALHFCLHGIHHRVPMDRLRLVLPPALLAALAVPVYAAFQLLLAPLTATGALSTEDWHALFGAGLAGYVAYDLVHYAAHHCSVSRLGGWPGCSLLGALKKRHLAHHFADVASVAGFGVTSPLWDWLCGTMLPPLREPAPLGGPMLPPAAAAPPQGGGGGCCSGCGG